MTKWSRIIFLIGCLVIVSAIHLWAPKIFQKKPPANAKGPAHHAKSKLGAYFFPIETKRLHSGEVPYVAVQIEDKTFLLKLDLGCSDCVYLAPEALSKIEHKTYQQLKQYYGFRGKAYERRIYDIPQIKIGHITFWHPLVPDLKNFPEKLTLSFPAWLRARSH